MRDSLQRLIAKADADDVNSLQALSLALMRAGYPKPFGLVRPVATEVILRNPAPHFRAVVTLLDGHGLPVYLPDPTFLCVGDDRQCIQIFVPNGKEEER